LIVSKNSVENKKTLCFWKNDEKVDELLSKCKKLDNRNLEMGVRAFVWNIEKMM